MKTLHGLSGIPVFLTELKNNYKNVIYYYSEKYKNKSRRGIWSVFAWCSYWFSARLWRLLIERNFSYNLYDISQLRSRKLYLRRVEILWFALCISTTKIDYLPVNRWQMAGNGNGLQKYEGEWLNAFPFNKCVCSSTVELNV